MATAATFVDNEVRFSEGPGLACAWCAHDVFENNLISQAAHPFGRSLQLQGTSTSHVTLRRNTIEYSAGGGIAACHAVAPSVPPPPFHSHSLALPALHGHTAARQRSRPASPP